MIFTVSVRGKSPKIPLLYFLATNYPHIPIAQIDSVFAFVEPTTLYGGRIFKEREISELDIKVMKEVAIGLRLPLTNLYVDYEEYEATRSLLEKYHVKGNSVIVVNEDLATWVRRDYPHYQIESSVISNIHSQDEIKRALEIFDTIVLPMHINNDVDFLQNIENKESITLFANAGCALNCPSKICYPSISKLNKFQGGEFKCSQGLKYRELVGVIDFDLKVLTDLGFERFKVLRSRESGITGY